jgi:hypothetical protein
MRIANNICINRTGANADVDIKNYYPHFADADADNSNIRIRIFTPKWRCNIEIV